MAGADLLGIGLLAGLVLFALRKREEIRGRKAPFLLLLVSLAAVLAAAPLGHLAVAALLAGLCALAAWLYSGPPIHTWKSRLRGFASAFLLANLLAATALYLVSAILSWEPPTLFASGPNGIPLDDVLLAGGSLSLLLLAAGLSRPPANEPEALLHRPPSRSPPSWA